MITLRHPITVALLGCGLWGKNILRDLLTLEVRVLVVDPDVSRPADFRSCAELPEVDGVFIATPASTHADTIDEVIDRGVPLFVEKPFTTDVESAERVLSAGGDRIFPMHVWRYHPGIEALADIARSGELGSITQLRTTRVNGTSPRTDVDSVWTLLPHDLSIAQAILGRIPSPRFAEAEVVGDRIHGMLALLSPLVAEISTRYGGEKRREVRVHFEGGTAVLHEGLIELRRESHVDKLEISQEPPLFRELSELVGFLRGGPRPRVTAEEGVAVVKAIAELRRMAKL